MLIRSQDKEMLFNFESIQNISIFERKKDFALYINYSNIMGIYGNKEKALKVLDMMQDTYENYEYEKAFKTGLRLFETFQMPEDEEVTEN